MPAATSADPSALRRFARDTEDLDARLTVEGRAVGTCIERVVSSCRDHLPPVPPLEQELLDLGRLSASLVDLANGVAGRFELADHGLLSGGAPAAGDAVTSPDPAAANLPPWVLMVLRAAVGLGAGDLTDIGRRLLGELPGGTETVDGASTAWTVLSPASGWLGLTTSTDLAQRLARLPGVATLLTRLGLSGAGPVVAHTGHGLTGLSLTEDVKRLVRDGNPIVAWRRDGAGYLAHWARLGFDGTSQACSGEPSTASCGAAAITGVAWGGLEIYEHREPIGRLAGRTSRLARAAAHQLRDVLLTGLADIDRNIGHLPATGDRPVPPGLLPPLLAPALQGATEIMTRAQEVSRNAGSWAAERAGRVATRARDGVTGLAGAAGEAWDRGWDAAFG